MATLFSVDGYGRLQYEPFKTYTLPRLVHEEDRQAVFKNHHGKEKFRRELYRLQWPGEDLGMKHDHGLPRGELTKLIGAFDPIDYLHPKDVKLNLRDFVRNPNVPDLPYELPDELSYHLAVNRQSYYDDGRCHHPVSGLPSDRVDQVLDAFFVPSPDARAALSYLKWIAKGHRRHPLLRSFDTNIREELMRLNQEAVWLYFYLLSDYRYDPETFYWSRQDKILWAKMATYLHWVRRTGEAMPPVLSKMEPDWPASQEIPKDIQDRFEVVRRLQYGMALEDEPEEVTGPPLDGGGLES